MAPFNWLSVTLTLLATHFPVVTLAQASDTDTNTVQAVPIPTRFTVDYNSSGGGYDGFGGFELIHPFHQRAGQRFDYLLGRLNLTNDADIGGNFLVGSRQRATCGSLLDNCVVGGYVGLDFTNTSAELFPQFGMGVEVLSALEFRLNGYIPLGETKRRVEDGFVGPTSVIFQGRNLALTSSSYPGRYQVALSGVDLEVGGKLVKLDNGGDLRVYGGIYNYGGEDVSRYWGGQFRLETRPTPGLSIGSGVQFDPEFGSNLLFRIGASFPTLAEQQDEDARQPVDDLLAGAPRRRNAAVVARRSETIEPGIPVIAVEPETGKPIEFIHVHPGRGSSQGTFEDPTRTIAEATDLITPTTNIIYVQSGNAGPGFTIPDGVAVLSVAPEQRIDTQFGSVLLPDSGQGISAQPLITDTVRMENNTQLSGFNVQPPIGQSGILASGDDGRLEISDNTISTVGDRASGISVFNRGESLISGNVISTQGDTTFGIGGVLGNRVTISNNSVSTTGYRGWGIFWTMAREVIISDNMVSTQGGEATGISATSTTPVISDNVISTNGNSADGISTRFVLGKSIISGNTVSTQGRDSKGVDWLGYQDAEISENTIQASGGDGFNIAAYDTGSHCLILANNISKNSGSGISYRLVNSNRRAFDIVDSSPLFTNTQASNIGTFSFEPITGFTNVPSCSR